MTKTNFNTSDRIKKILNWILAHHDWCLLATALLTRLAMAQIIGPGDHGDDDGTYLHVAQNILSGAGHVTHPMGLENVSYHSFLPPGMGIMITPIVYLFGPTFEPLRPIIILMSSLACLWLSQLGQKLMGNSGRLAGWIWALYPAQLFWSTRVNPHAIATNLLVLGLLWTFQVAHLKKRSSALMPFGLGAIWAALSLFRGEYLIAIGLLGAYLFWVNRSWKTLIFFGIGFSLTMSPWIVRNYFVHRAFVPVSTNSSRMFWETYHPNYHFSGIEIPFAENEIPALEQMNEMEFKTHLTNQTLNYIKANPLRAIYIWSGNMIHFWRPFVTPNVASIKQNLLYVAGYIPIFAFFMIGLCLAPYRKEPFWIVLALLIAYKWGVHAFFYIIIRFREAIVPLLILPATLAMIRLLEDRQNFLNLETHANKKYPD